MTTAHGWTLPLRHYAGEGPPVVLVHGLGVNGHDGDAPEDVSPAA